MVSRRVQALLDQLRAQGIQDEQVLNALAAVPREKFVDEAFEQKAWDNIALPIGQGQTISQPYMVARMTELLELTPQSRVLEIGTGSGYQTAILAHLVQHVCSVERIKIRIAPHGLPLKFPPLLSMMIPASPMAIPTHSSLRVLMPNRRLKHRVKRGTVATTTAAMR